MLWVMSCLFFLSTMQSAIWCFCFWGVRILWGYDHEISLLTRKYVHLQPREQSQLTVQSYMLFCFACLCFTKWWFSNYFLLFHRTCASLLTRLFAVFYFSCMHLLFSVHTQLLTFLNQLRLISLRYIFTSYYHLHGHFITLHTDKLHKSQCKGQLSTLNQPWLTCQLYCAWTNIEMACSCPRNTY